jgi:deoxyribose-phosphate aldolase
MIEPKKEIIASYIDHTLLKQTVTIDEIKNLCIEANEFNFASVCILPYYITYAKEYINNKNVKICTVIGFPLGANTKESKIYETKNAISIGANEIDMVANLPAFFNNDYNYVENEIKEIKKICKDNNVILKVIVETCLLNYEQKKLISKIVSNCGADFIKTSTGFSSYGATIEDVKTLKENVSPNVNVKASGGIKTLKSLIEMLEAGAKRIGTSSAINILKEIE